MANDGLEISVADVAARRTVGDVELVLLDVREHEELAIGRIDGTTHIPMGDIPGKLQHLDPDRDLIVFCHKGRRSMSVVQWLRQQGLPRVWSMRGGIDAWAREIDPGVPRY